ncbi:SMAD/FHA domain-containing protein [Basidiobolus meristosporus CBS 931.73]|uniref:SMAD/FHA domain-containing protein n=1 Tax=Basidiobolus meristosporus CBS 931.73 TaxID=1314790 RepID=A0A1Y1Y9F1_9FUNG|nr:SMAD/FHA domain-containing protein [Basidiobolus meristosporus CBS 931.73]|eukprot:ORX94608.1 SMAD/FHA domain-containing protein [Basidiobolus meristosporus CBS 931.73]
MGSDKSRSPPRNRREGKSREEYRRRSPSPRGSRRGRRERSYSPRRSSRSPRRSSRSPRREPRPPRRGQPAETVKESELQWGGKALAEEEAAAAAQKKLEEEAEKDKEKPNFGLSGKLAAETNTYNGVVVKYNEPPEARNPTKKWRLYVFKGKEQIDLLHIHRQSAYLVGRDRKIADIPVDHPSCSKQHAAFQFRQVVEKNEVGEIKRTVKPYIIDLEATNGTFVNGERIPPTRYYELKVSDVIKFGSSTREYVLLHENL